MANFPRQVKSITIVGGGDGKDDRGGSRVVFKRRRGKKRASRGLREIDKYVRRLAKAQESFGSSYLSRHDRSNRRRKNGWLRDIVSNTARAVDPAVRKITR